MKQWTPVYTITRLMQDLQRECPDVMFSPRTSCVQHKNKPGWKSADLALYSHNCTALEIRLHVQENGEYVLTAADDQFSQMVKSFIEGYFLGLYDNGAFTTPDTP